MESKIFINLIGLVVTLVLFLGCTQKSLDNEMKYGNYGINLNGKEEVITLLHYILKKKMGLVKGEYEKSEDFKLRIEDSFQMIEKATIIANNSVYGKLYLDKDLLYDADSECFSVTIKSVKKDLREKVKIAIPISEAKLFKKNRLDLVINFIFQYQYQEIILSKIEIKNKDIVYTAVPYDINYSYNSIDLTLEESIE